MDIAQYTQFLIDFSYFGIFVLIVLAGFVIPIPEEVVLLLAGYLAGIGIINVWMALLISIIGFCIGDSLVYFLTKQGSRFILKLRKKLNEQKVMEYEHHMKEHMGKTIFLSRFIIGFRIFGPLLAGLMKLKWRKFFFFDFLAIVIYASVLVFLGYHFDNKLAIVLTEVTIARYALFGLTLVVLGIFFSRRVKKKFKRQTKKK